jgi:hypothetical protein
MAERIDWLKIRLEYILPVLTVLTFASVLGLFYYLAGITMKAVVVAEEGTGGQQASAGILNALIYIIPAVIGGFVIAMLFKYRKRFTLRAFFGSAIFFATTFISFFFFEIILFVLQLRSFGMVVVDPYFSFVTSNEPYIVYYSVVEILIIPFSLFSGILVAYIVSSQRFVMITKNYALLFLGGLMGAFLAVILPTWTVVFMLVGLSVYDIYSVRHGPIREIMELTYGPENPPAQPSSNTPLYQTSSTQAPQAEVMQQELEVKNTQPRVEQPQQTFDNQTEFDEDDLLSSMTYGTAHWDLGIGDLVFYSMLGSHTFIYGTIFVPEFGVIAPIAIFLATTIGIIIGFMITLRLLSRQAMLPGLPMSIFLGLIAFGITITIFHLL